LARQHCVRLGPSSPPKKGEAQPLPQFLAHVYCDQAAECIRIPLGIEVGFGPGDTVLHGAQFPLPKRGMPPNFRPMSIVAKRSPISATAELL